MLCEEKLKELEQFNLEKKRDDFRGDFKLQN